MENNNDKVSTVKNFIDPRVPVVYEDIPKGYVSKDEDILKGNVQSKIQKQDEQRSCKNVNTLKTSLRVDVQRSLTYTESHKNIKIDNTFSGQVYDSCKNSENCVCEVTSPEIEPWVYDETNYLIYLNYEGNDTYREECLICKSNITNTQCGCCRRCKKEFEECICDFY